MGRCTGTALTPGAPLRRGGRTPHDGFDAGSPHPFWIRPHAHACDRLQNIRTAVPRKREARGCLNTENNNTTCPPRAGFQT